MLQTNIFKECILISNQEAYEAFASDGIQFVLKDKMPQGTAEYYIAHAADVSGDPIWVEHALAADLKWTNISSIPEKSALKFYAKNSSSEVVYETRVCPLSKEDEGGSGGGGGGEGEKNVIERVQENGVDLPVINKTVNVKVPQTDWNASTTAEGAIKNRPNLHTVATSGDYNDLKNKPSITEPLQSDWAQSTTTALDYIKNKPTSMPPTAHTHAASDVTSGVFDAVRIPSLSADKINSGTLTIDRIPTIPYNHTTGFHTVANTGSYNDLIDKPTIPAAQIQSDWNQTDTASKDYIKNKPTVGNAVITLKQGEVTKGSFALNSTSAATITLDDHVQANWNESSTTAPAYIQNKPQVGNATVTIKQGTVEKGSFNVNTTSAQTVTIDAQAQADYNQADTSAVDYIKNKPDLTQYATTATVSAIDSRVTTIEGKVPAAASTTNQLADKAFVNSSIATQTSRFRGTNSTATTETEFLEWANALTEKDPNDYVFWEHTVSENKKFDRYKYNGTTWQYEYSLNNSTFTAVQWAAINSSITESKVTGYDSHVSSTTNPHNVTAAQVGAYTTTQTDTLLAGKAASSHTHAAGDISSTLSISQIPAVSTFQTTPDDSHVPTEKLVNDKLATKADAGHVHSTTAITSGVFEISRIPTTASWEATPSNNYVPTEALVKTSLDSKAASVHTHVAADTTDGVFAIARIPAVTAFQATPDNNHVPTEALVKTALDGKASTTHNHAASEITSGTLDLDRIPTIPSTKTTGAFVLDQIPTIPSTKTSGFANVATSGSYNDLSDKPTIPTVSDAAITITQNGVTVDSFTLNQSGAKSINIAETQSDWSTTDSADVSFIKNKPNIYDTTITIKQGSATKGTFTLNQSTSATIEIDEQVQSDWSTTDPTAKSFIKNKPSIPSGQVQVDWNVTDTGDVRYILNKPTIPAPANNATITIMQGSVTKGSFTVDTSVSSTITLDAPVEHEQSDWSTTDTTAPSYIKNKPALHTVAITGNYSDLNGKPDLSHDLKDNLSSQTITSDESQTSLKLTNGSTGAFGGSYFMAYSSNNDEADIGCNNTYGPYLGYTKSGTRDIIYINNIATKDLIPDVNDPTITFTQGGTTKGSITLNQSTSATIALDAQIQSDWNQSTTTAADFIKNKPDLSHYLKDNVEEQTISTDGYVPKLELKNGENITAGIRFVADKSETVTQIYGNSKSINIKDIATTADIPTVNNPAITIMQGSATKGSFTLNQVSPATVTLDAQVQADWSTTDDTDPAYIQNKPNIPEVNNPTITIKQGTTTKGYFTLNQSTSSTITLDAPVTVTDVTIATTAWSGSPITASVTVSGLLATDYVMVSPQGASTPTVIDSQIYCSSQADDTLTFTANTTPSTTVVFTAWIKKA